MGIAGMNGAHRAPVTCVRASTHYTPVSPLCNCVATVKWQRRPNCNAELTEDDAVNRATASDRVSVLIYQFHFHFQFQFFDFSVFSLNYFLHTEK